MIEINNLKDLAFYYIRNQTPRCVSLSYWPTLCYKLEDGHLSIVSHDNYKKLEITFSYDYNKENKTYNYSVLEVVECSDEERVEVEFTINAQKKNLFNLGLAKIGLK